MTDGTGTTIEEITTNADANTGAGKTTERAGMPGGTNGGRIKDAGKQCTAAGRLNIEDAVHTAAEEIGSEKKGGGIWKNADLTKRKDVGTKKAGAGIEKMKRGTENGEAGIRAAGSFQE